MGQKVSLYQGLSLRENVEFYAGLYGLDGAALEERWGALRERFALGEAEREQARGPAGRHPPARRPGARDAAPAARALPRRADGRRRRRRAAGSSGSCIQRGGAARRDGVRHHALPRGGRVLRLGVVHRRRPADRERAARGAPRALLGRLSRSRIDASPASARRGDARARCGRGRRGAGVDRRERRRSRCRVPRALDGAALLARARVSGSAADATRRVQRIEQPRR